MRITATSSELYLAPRIAMTLSIFVQHIETHARCRQRERILAKSGNSPSPFSSIRDSATSPTLMNKLLLLLLLLVLLLLLLQLTSKITSSLELRRKDNGKKVIGVDGVVVVVFAMIRFVVGGAVLGRKRSVAVFVCSGDDGENDSTPITARRTNNRLLLMVIVGIE